MAPEPASSTTPCDPQTAENRAPPSPVAASPPAPPRPAPPSQAPSEWSIDEVIDFIAASDPGMAVHADLFRKHVSITIFESY